MNASASCPRRLIRAPVVLLLVGIAAGVLATPLQAQGKRAQQLLTDQPPPRRGCSVLPAPRRLPALSQLADSARLTAAVAAFAEQFPVREGPVFALYSIAFDRDGRVERLAPIDYRLPEGKIQTLQQVVRESLLPQPNGKWSVRLRIEPADTPRFQLGYSEWCPPRSRTQFTLQTPAAYPLPRPQAVRLRMWVTADGVVAGTEMISGTGASEVDRWVERTLQEYRFEPALLDGVAVAVHHEETVRIKARP